MFPSYILCENFLICTFFEVKFGGIFTTIPSLGKTNREPIKPRGVDYSDIPCTFTKHSHIFRQYSYVFPSIIDIPDTPKYFDIFQNFQIIRKYFEVFLRFYRVSIYFYILQNIPKYSGVFQTIRNIY